jgi:hypothetical protein
MHRAHVDDFFTDWRKIYGEELYDHSFDCDENINLAHRYGFEEQTARSLDAEVSVTNTCWWNYPSAQHRISLMKSFSLILFHVFSIFRLK